MTRTVQTPTRTGRTKDPTSVPTGVAATSGSREPSRTGGWVAITGAVVMISGAICHSAFGADLFAAMESEDRAEVATTLTDVAEHHTVLAIGTFLWILGACTMSLGGTLILRRTTNQWASVARWAFAAASGAVIVFFSAMLAIVERLAPAHARGEDVITLVQVVGKGAATADWITTALILGVGYGAVVFSGRSTWAPRWLQYLAGTCLAVSLASVIAYVGESTLLGFVDVVVGLATVISTGVVATRRGS